MTATTTTARRAPATRLLALHDAINHVLLRAWCAAPSRWGRGTIHTKAKAPVLENTFRKAVATPTESGVLSRPDFLDAPTFGRTHGFGLDGWSGNARRTSLRVFSTSSPPALLENDEGGLKSRKGAKTMTTSPMASRSAAPTSPTFDPVATHFEAVNAAAMARWYAARYNHPAAARKAGQALSALRKLVQFECAQATSASPCTGCRDNFPLPDGPLDFFDTHVVQDYIQRRTACTLRPAAQKPCLPKGGAA